MTEPFRPRLRLLALMAATAVLAASCGLSRDTAGETAATITFADGTVRKVSTDELNSFHDTIEDDIDFTVGAFGGALPPGLRSSILADMIVGSVLDQLLDENGAEVSPDAVAAGAENLETTIAGFFPLDDDPAATAAARFETLPYLPFLAELEAKQIALGDALVANAPPGEVVEVPCSSHILVASEEEALEVIGLLEDGGDFAELATEFSTDSSGPAGGELGCSDPNGFVPEFRDAIVGAPVGTVIGPVETQFGFHVITVTEIEEQTVGGPDARSLVGTEVLSAISQITVDVDPALGEWDAARGTVIPPG